MYISLKKKTCKITNTYKAENLIGLRRYEKQNINEMKRTLKTRKN
jgi:hypothetical protein